LIDNVQDQQLGTETLGEVARESQCPQRVRRHAHCAVLTVRRTTKRQATSAAARHDAGPR
jgi:hypothetical protein